MKTEVDELTTNPNIHDNPYSDAEFDSAYREEAEQFLEEFGMDATHGQLRAWVEAHSKALQQ